MHIPTTAVVLLHCEYVFKMQSSLIDIATRCSIKGLYFLYHLLLYHARRQKQALS